MPSFICTIEAVGWPGERKGLPQPADEPGARFLLTVILFACSMENSKQSPIRIANCVLICFGRVICPLAVTLDCNVGIPYISSDFVGKQDDFSGNHRKRSKGCFLSSNSGHGFANRFLKITEFAGNFQCGNDAFANEVKMGSGSKLSLERQKVVLARSIWIITGDQWF
jgi:hypothetical protein